jgi:hypothetical protein
MKDTLREIFVISTHSDYSDIISPILQTKMSVYSIFYLGTKSCVILTMMCCYCQRAWKKPVVDRIGLIIEIFNAHAFTKEAKLQVCYVVSIQLFD